jgi:hypothetical protein
MHRGSRRRARTIGQRSIGGLSVLSVSAAVIVGGAFHPLHGAARHPASGRAAGVTTLTETSKTSDGTLTVQVKYRNEPHGNVKVLGLTISGTPTFSLRRAFIHNFFGPAVPNAPGLPVTKCGHFGGVGSGVLVALHKGRKFTDSERIGFDVGIGHNLLCDNSLVTASVTAAPAMGGPRFHVFMEEAVGLVPSFG